MVILPRDQVGTLEHSQELRYTFSTGNLHTIEHMCNMYLAHVQGNMFVLSADAVVILHLANWGYKRQG